MSTQPEEQHAATDDRPELNRVLGPKLLLLFVVGDILGTGIYALTGKVAAEVGGAVWIPFICAFLVALFTAFGYLELVTKYPRAGGAAAYTHQAFRIQLLTFLVTFAVMSSGLTSASSSSKAFAGNLFAALGLDEGTGWGVTIAALVFMTVIALVNLRGVGESVKVNVVLTSIELTGLLIVIAVGIFAISGGQGDLSRLTQFHTPDGDSAFGAVTAATALAFFAMVGFEDAVNMAEETKDPVKVFPKTMLLGLFITIIVYLAVSISAVTLVAPQDLGEGETPLLKVIEAGAPGLPLFIFAWITIFAVSNTALINMMMASRLLYGMSREKVLPGPLGRVLKTRKTPHVAIIFTTLLAFALIAFADLEALGGTTSLLLLCVFTLVNLAVIVLRFKEPTKRDHFKTPLIFPILGMVMCAYLASPLSGRSTDDYLVAGVLMAVGLVLSVITLLLNRFYFHRKHAITSSHTDPRQPWL